MVHVGIVVIILVVALLRKEIFENVIKKLNRSNVVPQLTAPSIDRVTSPVIDQVAAADSRGKELFKSFDDLTSKLQREYDLLPREVQKVINNCSNFECIINFIITKPRLYKQSQSLINDLLVAAVMERELIPEDFDVLFEFLFGRRLYREIAMIISLIEPMIEFIYLKPFSKRELTRVFDYLFMISKAEVTNFRIEYLFNDLREGITFVAPLIAAEEFDEEIFKSVARKYLTKMTPETVQFIHEVCLGFALQSKVKVERNDMIIKYIESIVDTQRSVSMAIYLSVKTCKILNLLKSEDLMGVTGVKDERIHKLIYNDPYYRKMIDSNNFEVYIFDLLIKTADSSRDDNLKDTIYKYF